MIVGGDGNEFLGPLLPDHVFVQLLLDPVGRGDVVDGKNRLARPLLFLFHLGSGIAEAPASAEDVAQVEEADGGTGPGTAGGFLLLCVGVVHDLDIWILRVIVLMTLLPFFCTVRGGGTGRCRILMAVPGIFCLLRSGRTGPCSIRGCRCGRCALQGIAEHVEQALEHVGVAGHVGEVHFAGEVHHFLHAV